MSKQPSKAVTTMNELNQPTEQTTEQPTDVQESANHSVAIGVEAAGGGVTGAAIGHAIAGKVGAAVGGVAGAIAGGMAGEAFAPALQSSIAEVTEALLQETSPSLGLGADAKEIELPDHYAWEKLQALSQPQSDAN